MIDKNCELCAGTGWYGDNGPGIGGNKEYHPCEKCKKPYSKMTVREACRKRIPLDGTDAQALEHALTQVEQELAEAKEQAERYRIASLKGDVWRARCKEAQKWLWVFIQEMMPEDAPLADALIAARDAGKDE